MEESLKTEIMKGASLLGLTEEEAMSKFEEICSENNIETTNPIGKALWRNFTANALRSQKSGNENKSNDSYYKKAFGFFVSLEAPRDMMSYNRARAKEEQEQQRHTPGMRILSFLCVVFLLRTLAANHCRPHWRS